MIDNLINVKFGTETDGVGQSAKAVTAQVVSTDPRITAEIRIPAEL